MTLKTLLIIIAYYTDRFRLFDKQDIDLLSNTGRHDSG